MESLLGYFSFAIQWIGGSDFSLPTGRSTGFRHAAQWARPTSVPASPVVFANSWNLLEARPRPPCDHVRSQLEPRRPTCALPPRFMARLPKPARSRQAQNLAFPSCLPFVADKASNVCRRPRLVSGLSPALPLSGVKGKHDLPAKLFIE